MARPVLGLSEHTPNDVGVRGPAVVDFEFDVNSRRRSALEPRHGECLGVELR